MKSRTIGALLKGAGLAGPGVGALFLSAMLAAGTAFAYPTWNSPSESTSGSLDCTGAIKHSDASCLHGWWDNTPPASTGVPGGSTWGMQNRCGDWGTVFGWVEKQGTDYGYRMPDWGKKRGYAWFHDVRNIKCCPEKGELCHKSQVKALSGKIKIWDDSSNEYVRVDVSTTEKRQHFCSQWKYRTGVYCRNDLSGDAMDARAYNCGNHYCNADDCQWHFEESSAYETCQGEDGETAPTYSISATDGSGQTCTVTAQCKDVDGVITNTDGTVVPNFYWVEKTISAEVWDLDDAVNCEECEEEEEEEQTTQ